jgi:hypothetical protein
MADGRTDKSASPHHFSKHPGHGKAGQTVREFPGMNKNKDSAGQIPNPAQDPIRVIQ